MTMLLFVVGTVAFFLVAINVMRVRAMLAHTLHRPSSIEIAMELVPDWLQRQFASVRPELESLGFTISHFEQREEIYLSAGQPEFTMVLTHSKEKSFVFVSNSHAPDAALTVRIEFATYFTDNTVYTMQGHAGGVIPGGNVVAADADEYDMPEQWSAHLKTLEPLDQALGARQYPQTPDACVARWNRMMQRHFDWLHDAGKVRPVADGCRLRLSTALQMRASVVRGDTALQSWRVRRLAQTEVGHDPDLHTAEAQAYTRLDQIQAAGSLEGIFKTAIFAASAIFFAILFGVAWSPRMLLFLVPVLLLHELGHLLAMRAFGYRDLQVLFLPFGAAVIGKKKDISAWKEVVVYLAGPVPGLLIALGVALTVPDLDARPWLAELTWMLAGLNFLNLLPFGPLDGGQLVNRLLAGRLPFLPALSQVFTLTLFALGWLALGDSILAMLTLYLGWTLWIQVRHWWRWRRAGARLDRAVSERSNVECAFTALAPYREPFVLKYQQVQNFVAQLKVPRARWSEVFGGLALYAVVLIGPPVAWMLNSDPYASLYSAEFWDQRIELAGDAPADLFALNAEAGEMMWESSDYENATRFLTTALTLGDNKKLDVAERQTDVLYMLTSVDSANLPKHLERLESVLPADDPRLAEVLHSAAMYADGEDTMKYLARALEIYATDGDIGEQISVMQTIAGVHSDRGDTAAAVAVLREAIGLGSKAPDNELAADMAEMAAADLARVYVMEDRLEDARNALQSSLTEVVNEFSSSYLRTQLGWVELYAGNAKAAAVHFTANRTQTALWEAEVRSEMNWLLRKFWDFGDDEAEPRVQTYDVVVAHQLGDLEQAGTAVDLFLSAIDDEGYSSRQEFLADLNSTAGRCLIAPDESDHCRSEYARQSTLLLQAILAVNGE